jgi:hypothetical protein
MSLQLHDRPRLCCSFTTVGQNHLMGSLRGDGRIHFFIEFPGTCRDQHMRAVRECAHQWGARMIETALYTTPALDMELSPRPGDPIRSFLRHARRLAEVLSAQ